MNKGINDLIQLIEKETHKAGKKRKKQYGDKKANKGNKEENYTFQPKINKKSQKISDKLDQQNPKSQRIHKGRV